MNKEMYEIFFSLPTYEQKAHLGDCGECARRRFVKFLMKMPLDRAEFNYRVLANQLPWATDFVREIMIDYLARNERATENKVNREMYNKAIDYIYGGKGHLGSFDESDECIEGDEGAVDNIQSVILRIEKLLTKEEEEKKESAEEDDSEYEDELIDG